MNLKPLGQDAAWSSLLKSAQSLPQGMILVGPSGVGKRRSVRALYQWMNCADGKAKSQGAPCGACVSCKKIAQGLHADFLEISPKGDSIAVDDLREMKKTLFFPPLEGSLRLVLIDEAHRLNAYSANSLLKTLEEPPAHTRFFLLTHERGLLPATILSRCQFLYFSPLDEATMKILLERMGVNLDPKLEAICMPLLSGGLARAAELTQEKTQAFLQSLHNTLDRGLASWDEAVRFSESLGPEDWKLELALDILLHLSATRVKERLAAGAEHATKLGLKAAYLRRRLERHANKKLVALATAELVRGLN